MGHTPRIAFLAPTRIGDAVLASALLAHIAATRPDARVTIVASPFSAPLFEHYPLLERLVVYTKQRHSRHWLTIWKALAGTRWDAVWDMHGSATAYLLRTKRRYVFSGGHEQPKVKQFEERFGISALPYPILWPSQAQREKALELLAAGTNYLVFGPCANWPPKEWPMRFYIELGRMLLEKSGFCDGWRPVIVCAPHERERAAALLSALAPFHPVDLTDGTHDLLTIYACMERAQGYIGNDSGLMHMAAAAGIPTLGLFGPTPSVVYQPWGKRAKAIVAPEGKLDALSVQVVAQAFAELRD